MKLPIAGSASSIAEILSKGPRLVVPYFQRGYAWQREHVERLLNDLTNYASGRQDIDWYPLGAIILGHDGSDSSDTEQAEIADGHQRLISLTLIIAALRDCEDEAELRARLHACIIGPDGLIRLTTLETARQVLLDFVQLDGATQNETEDSDWERSPSEVAIIENRDWLVGEIAKLPANTRRRLANFLLDRTLLIVISVTGGHAARLMFATMHETGIRPKVSDLLKSRVLGRCSLANREQARSAWDWLENRLGRNRMETLFLDLVAIKTRAIASEPPDVALARAFNLDTVDSTGPFVLDTLRPLGNLHLELLSAGLNESARPGAVYRRLQYLGWVTRHDTWRLPALHWLSQTSFDDPATIEFLKRLEALAWMQMIRTEEIVRRDQRYLMMLDEIDQGRALETGGALAISPEEHAAAYKVLAGGNFFRRQYKLFLLLRLNGAKEGDDAVRPVPEATVEHILPQRPRKASQWERDFSDHHEVGRLRHALGNLTLLTESEQNSAGNRDFDGKRPVFRGSSFALSREIADSEHWRPENIEARTERLVAEFFRAIGVD